jgi:hypothetical protein
MGSVRRPSQPRRRRVKLYSHLITRADGTGHLHHATTPRVSLAALENAVDDSSSPEPAAYFTARFSSISRQGGLYSSTINSAPDGNFNTVPFGKRDSFSIPANQRSAPRCEALSGSVRSIVCWISASSSSETADHWSLLRLSAPNSPHPR